MILKFNFYFLVSLYFSISSFFSKSHSFCLEHSQCAKSKKNIIYQCFFNEISILHMFQTISNIFRKMTFLTFMTYFLASKVKVVIWEMWEMLYSVRHCTWNKEKQYSWTNTNCKHILVKFLYFFKIWKSRHIIPNAYLIMVNISFGPNWHYQMYLETYPCSHLNWLKLVFHIFTKF